jgi:maltose O-acetyltransferase
MKKLRWIFSEGLLYFANRVVPRVPIHKFRLAFYRRVMKFTIGKSSAIFMDAWFDAKGGFVLGEYCVINQKCRFDTRGGIEIGNNVSISAEVCVLTADHDVKTKNMNGRKRKVTIGDFVFIGTRAMILPGVTVGRAAVIGAGAVVTKDVPDYAVVAGCPARHIGTREEGFDYDAEYFRLFQ